MLKSFFGFVRRLFVGMTNLRGFSCIFLNFKEDSLIGEKKVKQINDGYLS